jgi:serine/threonine-protein kinase
VDARADIYSLGIVMYEMLTGRKPFRADTPMAIIVKHINDPLPSPSQYVPDLPVAVESMVLKALEKKPENRYQGMGEFVSVMNTLVAGGMLKSNQTLSESTGTVTEVLSPSSIVSTRMVGWLATGALAIALLVGFIGWMAIPPGSPIATEAPILEEAPVATEAPVVTEAPIVTEVPVATEAPIVTEVPIATEAPVVTEAPVLVIGSTMIGEDGATLVYVPEGEFTMGSDSYPEEMPIHTVYLGAFWIDQTEVTNGMYVKCVSAGICQEPLATTSRTHVNYYGNSEFNNYPVVAVKWNMAKVYCEWTGRRLPTEAEWEKAARGTDGRIYPWGNDVPNKDLLNYNKNVGDTAEVGNYPEGKSIYGAYNMAGNVWEWVNDWYSETYYQSSPTSNPLGPDSGIERVMRGGSWEGLDTHVRSVSRGYFNPNKSTSKYGFRCARSVP